MCRAHNKGVKTSEYLATLIHTAMREEEIRHFTADKHTQSTKHFMVCNIL